jgi:hypothetical protein
VTADIGLTSNNKRRALIAVIAARIAALSPGTFLRIAIDGVDGAGKTTFADELAFALLKSGRPIIRASTDDFHNPRAARYRRGKRSPEGSIWTRMTTRRSAENYLSRSVHWLRVNTGRRSSIM